MDQTARILIVDDQPHHRHLVAKSLHEEGYRTVIVDNVDSAWEHLKEFQPHMVLLNAISEGFDSFCLLLEIKQRTPDFPVLLYAIRSGDAIDRLKETITGVLGLSRLVESCESSHHIRFGGSPFKTTARFEASSLEN